VSYQSDRDGKSKTASGVDAAHYPEQHETVKQPDPEIDSKPTPEQIAHRAFELWVARGCPEGSAERDWLQAEADLTRELEAHAPVEGVRKETGTVQR